MSTSREIDETQVKKLIEKQLKEHSILIYMKGTPTFPQCGFSSQAVSALKSCRKEFSFVNILENPDIRAILPKYSDWPTFPQLYINGELIGGCDIILEMKKSGELKTAVSNAELQN